MYRKFLLLLVLCLPVVASAGGSFSLELGLQFGAPFYPDYTMVYREYYPAPERILVQDQCPPRVEESVVTEVPPQVVIQASCDYCVVVRRPVVYTTQVYYRSTYRSSHYCAPRRESWDFPSRSHHLQRRGYGYRRW